MAVEPLTDAVAYLEGDGGVEEIGGADLDGGGACHEEFDGVLCTGDAAEPDDWNAHCLGYLVYHAEGNGFDAGTAESSRADGEERLAALDIDGHAHEGVDE